MAASVAGCVPPWSAAGAGMLASGSTTPADSSSRRTWIRRCPVAAVLESAAHAGAAGAGARRAGAARPARAYRHLQDPLVSDPRVVFPIGVAHASFKCLARRVHARVSCLATRRGTGRAGLPTSMPFPRRRCNDAGNDAGNRQGLRGRTPVCHDCRGQHLPRRAEADAGAADVALREGIRAHQPEHRHGAGDSAHPARRQTHDPRVRGVSARGWRWRSSTRRLASTSTPRK